MFNEVQFCTSLLTFTLQSLNYTNHVDHYFKGTTMSWIKSSFLGNESSIISLLSREELYPQQTAQEHIEVTQLHIHIVKVLIRCIILLERYDDFDTNQMESLIKILLTCLERVDLKNFHVLGK